MDAKFWRHFGKRKSPEQKLQEAGGLWFEESEKTRPMLDWAHMTASLPLGSSAGRLGCTWTQKNPLPVPLYRDVPIQAAPRPSLPKELIAGPLIAYRTWKLRVGSGKLFSSTGVDGSWLYERPQKADCHGYSGVCMHDEKAIVPASGCQCGWYALKTEQEAENRDDDLLGTVALWGKVIAHAKGYRAQYAWPLRVTYKVPMPGFPLARNIRKELEAIAANYGCEVFVGDEAL